MRLQILQSVDIRKRDILNGHGVNCLELAYGKFVYSLPSLIATGSSGGELLQTMYCYILCVRL